MDEFLSLTREALNELENYSKVHVVIGNESCDLDSTVSSLVYAYYLYTIDEDESVLFLPLMQIPRSKFRLRLETVHFLEKIGIEPDILTFYEDISLEELQTKGKLLVTLVDHHVLTPNLSDLESSVVKVIDHRPKSKQWPASVECKIEPVGSCCTLIAEEVLTNPDFPFDGIVNVLLYGTILIDTINMSPEAGKTTDKDTLMIHKLEDTLEEMGVDRDTLYEDLNDAKFDLSGLTTSEILDKDMKIIHGNNLNVAMCSVTMEMKELFTRPDLESELKKLSEEKNVEVVIIMTLSNQDGSPTRQLALYSENRIYKQQINDVLVACQSPSLQLELIPAPTDNIQAYSQGNVQASRKKILPVVTGFLTGEPSPDEAINQLQNTLSPGDQGSNSSVIGAMADSGKGESDHEQHILSNETMSPEVMDMFDPFSTQLSTIDNSEKDTKGSDLFQEHTNETSSSNQWSNGSMINDTNMVKSSDNDNSEVNASNTQSMTSISTSNDVFNIEPAETNSSLSTNHHYENNTTNNEEDHFELTEADMYNFGVNTNLGTESPLDYASGANSGQGSKMSSYPVTPPNSYFDTGLMSRQQDLPSFNNSEMVQIIKARQASMGKRDSENNSDGEQSEPFTPANSYISDSFNTFAKETNLPSFQNSDLVSKIREKRASLDNASGGESLGVNSFPYTPHNSYVDKSFDQFAAHGFSGPELTKRLSEERFDAESDANLDSDFSGISTTDNLLESAQSASKASDLLNMGLVKSGSSDTESSGDVNSPNEPVVVQDMIAAEHSNMNQASPNNESQLPTSTLTESDAANNDLLSEIPKPVSEEQQVDDLFQSILDDSGTSDSLTAVSNDLAPINDDVKPDDNVVKSQISEQMSLNQPLDLFGDLSSDPLASTENDVSSNISKQMSSDQPENIFDDLLGGSSVLNTDDGNHISTNLSQQLSSDHPENLFNDLLGDTDASLSKSTDNGNEVASNLTQQLSSDQPEDLFNDLLGSSQVPSSQPAEATFVGSNLTQQMSSDQPEDLFNDLLGSSQVASSQLTEATSVGSNVTQQMSSDQPEDLFNDLLGSSQVPSSQPTETTKDDINLTQQMSSDQPEGLFNDLIGDPEVPWTQPMTDNAVASELTQQFLSDQPEDLLNDLVSSESDMENISASHLSQQMSSDQQSSLGGAEDLSVQAENHQNVTVAQGLASEKSPDGNNAEGLLDDLLTNSDTKDNVLASNIMENMSFDNPGYDDSEPKVESSTEDHPNDLLNDLTDGEESDKNVVASQISTEMSDPESIQVATTQLFQDLCEDSQSTNVVVSEMADSLNSQQSEEDANVTNPNLTNNLFDNIHEETKERRQTNSTGSIEDNFDPNPNAFDPFSSLLSDEPEDNRNIFDPFAPIKSEEDSPNSPTKQQESNTPSSNEESTNPFRQSNPFNSMLNVEESMSSQQEKVFDPFSTISTEGEQIVSGFGDSDESSGNLSNNNVNPFLNVSDQPEADQIPSSSLESSPDQNTTDTDVMISTEHQQTESAQKEQNITDNTDVLNFQQSFGSDPSPSFETGIFKESVSSADEMFDQNIPASNQQDIEVPTLKPNFDGIRNAMVHQPSIQSDLSTSFDFNEGNSETYSDVSPMETKDRFGTQELIPEEPGDESFTQSVPTMVEKSHLGKLIGAELVHQPSIQSDLSTSFEDKSDYMIESNPSTPVDNPSNSDTFSKPIKPSDLPLQTEDDIMDKSGVYFPESGVKFLQPESDSSLYNESSENEEVSPSQNDEVHSNDLVNDDQSILEKDLVDPAIEEQLLKTSSELVENAFKEALDIEAAHIREENIESEANPQSPEDEDTESNTTNDADESVSSTKVNLSENVNDAAIEDEQIAEEAIREVAVAFTDELIKEALDSFDEVTDPPPNSSIPETEQHREIRRAPPLNKSSNSLSLETDYLPEMDPLRGNLDIFSGAEHSTTISTDAEREVAEAASFRKISSEESPSQHLEILEKLREDAERNRHVEATSEELRQATLDDSLEDLNQNPDELVDNEKQTNEDIPKSESLYDNLADTPSSEILEPFPDPVDIEPILTADKVQDNQSSLPQTDNQSSNDKSGIEFIENKSDDDVKNSADSSDPLNESSTDDFGMPANSSPVTEYQDSASAEMIHASREPTQNQSMEPKVIVQEPLEKVAVEETFTKQNSTQNESSINTTTESMLDPTNDNLSTSYTSLSDKEKKEVYMTSAGRISIARGESEASIESGMTSLTTDPRLEEEHQQDVVETTPTPTESKVDNEEIYKDKQQDEESSPAKDDDAMDDEIRQRDDSAASIESPLPDDTPAKSSSSEPIAEYTAAEELEDSKRWKVVNVGDKEYRIDLIVIEPYKKVISHGGYYGEGLNALIVFSGCYLPDKRRKDYQYVMEHLFVYVVHTLEELVAEDYMIVYFHGATPKKQSPSFSWLKKCYQMIDRRLKKNLKSLFLVHPTLWLRTVVLMTKPFISSKFSSKLKFVKTLQDLGQIIPMENLNIPDAVKVYDEKIYQSLSTPSTTPSTPS